MNYKIIQKNIVSNETDPENFARINAKTIEENKILGQQEIGLWAYENGLYTRFEQAKSEFSADLDILNKLAFIHQFINSEIATFNKEDEKHKALFDALNAAVMPDSKGIIPNTAKTALIDMATTKTSIAEQAGFTELEIGDITHARKL